MTVLMLNVFFNIKVGMSPFASLSMTDRLLTCLEANL